MGDSERLYIVDLGLPLLFAGKGWFCGGFCFSLFDTIFSIFYRYRSFRFLLYDEGNTRAFFCSKIDNESAVV